MPAMEPMLPHRGGPAGEQGIASGRLEEERADLAAERARLAAEEARLVAEQARLEHAASFLQACAESVAAARDEILRGAEGYLVDLVLKIASRVIHDEVSQRPDLITAQVQAALARVREEGAITVRIHPSAVGLVQEARSRLLEPLEATTRVHFEPDASIAPGGCVVETTQRIVDARIESQLVRIGDELRNDLSESP